MTLILQLSRISDGNTPSRIPQEEGVLFTNWQVISTMLAANAPKRDFQLIPASYIVSMYCCSNLSRQMKRSSSTTARRNCPLVVQFVTNNADPGKDGGTSWANLTQEDCYAETIKSDIIRMDFYD